MGKIYVTTDLDRLVAGKVKKPNGTEEYLVIEKGQVVELDEQHLTQEVLVHLANGNLREVEKPKKQQKKEAGGNDNSGPQQG